MNMWTALVAIVTVGCIAGVISSYFNSRQSRREGRQREAVETRLDDAERRNRELEERVRTLERIVTDGRYDLKKEFESLER